MGKMGFNHKGIHLFMNCISSVKYNVSHAGNFFGSITPTRGLRQGDPLSSYLFLICIEGLTALIKYFESRSLIKGVKVARSSPSISHLLFVDDSYIFCKANMESVGNVIDVLEKE